VDGDEDLLGSGPRLPRPVRIAAGLLAGATIVTLIAVHVWPHTRHGAATAPPLSTWPDAAGACGRTPLPLVSSTRPAERTGIRVLLGGDRLRTGDFDTGQWRNAPGPRLERDEFVTAYEPGYVATVRCDDSRARVLRLGDSSTTVVSQGAVVLSARDAAVCCKPAFVPLNSGRRVWLPPDFQAEAIAGDLVVGQDSSGLVMVEAATGRVSMHVGVGAPLATNDRVLVWTGTCDNPTNPCPVHRRVLATGATSDYLVPRSPRPLDAQLSHDGRRIAFTLRRAEPDPRFHAEYPAPPADIAILHFDTGRVEIVPGIEVPPPGHVGLAFSADDRWLVIALNAGPRIRLLAWRSGLTRPYESAPVAARPLGAPPIEVLG
jgi:hypothetical protein